MSNYADLAMETKEPNVLHPNFDYSYKKELVPQYEVLQLQQVNGGTSQVIQLNSTSQSQFALPANIWNLSKSFLQFEVGFPIQTVTGCNYINPLTPPIQTIRLKNRRGGELVTINDFDKYFYQTARVNKPVEEADGPFSRLSSTSAAAILSTPTTFTNITPNTWNTAFALESYSASRLSATGVVTNDLYQMNDSPQSVYAGASNTALTVSCQLNFKDIPHTLFSVPRDIPATEIIDLHIDWKPGVKFMGHFGAPDATALPAAVSAPVPTVTNMNLYLYIQQNPKIRESLMAKVNSGSLKMICPWAQTYIESLGNTSTAQSRLKLNTSNGHRLLRIYSSLYNSTDAINVQNNFFNVSASNGILSSWQTRLDSIPLQNMYVELSKQLDWILQRNKFKGSMVTDLMNFRSTCPCWCQDFADSDEPLIESKEKDLAERGRDLLGRELLYEMNILSKSTGVYASAFHSIIGQKVLMCGPNGLDLI